MDLFWSKTKNWALHNFNNSLIWNHYMVQWAIKNSISIHSSLSYRQIEEKSLFSCDSVRLFHNDLICISWMNKNVEICRHSLLLLCSSRMQTKGCWKASQISWQAGLRPPGDLGNIQCERKHVTHEQLEIDFGCQWSPTRVSSSSK